MWIQKQPPLHLTYCLSAHAGEAWSEHFQSIQTDVLEVKRRIAPDGEFGLGLRLGYTAAQSLSTLSNLNPLIDLLGAQGLYVFTINAFPFGNFHGTPVKTAVYEPDWRTDLRVDYACIAAELLTRLLPDGRRGSVSTLPVAWKDRMKNDADWAAAADRILETAAFLSTLEQDTGKWIQLAFEPEPGCFMETVTDTVLTYNLLMRLAVKKGFHEDLWRRYVGVCLDTSHAAVMFEDPLDALEQYAAEGIPVAKIQLSAALEAMCTPAVLERLAVFNEPVHLHQTTLRREDGSTLAWPDLGVALAALKDHPEEGQLRVHFHVPLYWAPSSADGSLWSTAGLLTDRFFERLKTGITEHLEIETYSLQALPGAVRPTTVVDSVVRELEWVRERMERAPAPG